MAVPNPEQLKKPDWVVSVSMFYPAFESRRYYMELEKDPSFMQPIPYASINPEKYTGIALLGGNTPSLKHFLECKILQSKIQDFWALKRPLGAIGQGVLVLARTTEADSKNSLIYNKKTTCYPKWIDLIGKYNPFGTAVYIESTEEEVIRSLYEPSLFRTENSIIYDTLFDQSGFICRDDWYLSARWEGDAYSFSTTFASMVLDCPFESQDVPQNDVS